MVDRWLRLTPAQAHAALQAQAGTGLPIGPMGSAAVPILPPVPGQPKILFTGAPAPVDTHALSTVIKINGDGTIEFAADPYANGGDTYTLWQRSTHSLVLRKRYQGGAPDKFFIFVIEEEKLTDKNEVFIDCWQLCQMPADAISFDVDESHRRQTGLYITVCAASGIEPDWGEHTEEVALAAEAKDNAWDTWATDHPAPEKEEA